MFVIRISGRCCHPSARMAPCDTSPMRVAVSRLEMKFWNTPSTMIGVRCAGTPSSSQPNEPSPPGSDASAVIETSGLA